MEKYRVLEVKESIFKNNDERAKKLREEMKERKVFLLNLMSSPGSGKTTTLSRTIQMLGNDLKIGVMEADIDSDVDAETIAKTGARVIQLHRRNVSPGCRDDQTGCRGAGNRGA